MAKKIIKNLVIKTKDHKSEHQFTSALVFATKYVKGLEVNEFHTPKACKLIIESDTKIICYLLNKPFIIVDEKGNVEILTTASYAKVSMQEPYYSELELKEAQYLVKAYKYKAEIGLSTKEVMDRAHAEDIVEIEKAKKIQIPFRIGGGF